MSLNERDNTQRCLKVLMQHLEELRPILNTRNLDDRAINAARDLVKAFVLSETNAGPRGTIFRGEHFSETGEPLLGTPLGLKGPSSQVFWSDECQDLLTEHQWSYMSMILNMLVAFAQESLTRERAELAKEIGNCASDFVESLTGKPWETIKPCVGVTLLNAALILTDGNHSAARETVKAWRNSRNPKLPLPVGAVATDSRKHLFDPTELAQFIRLVEGSKWGQEQDDHLSAKVVEGQPTKVRVKRNRLQSSAKSLPVKSARVKKSRRS